MSTGATTIIQKPLYKIIPVGQEIIFVISNSIVAATESQVRYIAEVHISNGTPPDLSTADNMVGKFKTTPNNAGVGVFDFRQILESYVSADNMAAELSSYKGVQTIVGDRPRYAMHQIDKFSTNTNSMRWLGIQFSMEFNGQGSTKFAVNSANYAIFNGYLKYTDILNLGTLAASNDFGYNLDAFNLINSGLTSDKRFLTNAPYLQYANLEDYGTLALFSTNKNNQIDYIALRYFDSSGSQIGGDDVDRKQDNGANNIFSSFISTYLLFFGCFPANLQNWSSTFAALVTAGTIQGGKITIEARDLGHIPLSAEYTIQLNCPDLKGYESIRLCWINQWGAWDYYTFTKKSTRNISTQGSTYEQLAGTWNDSSYRVDSFRGGKKAFRVNATEKITMNSNFVSENENTMFEELINSPEVYILKGFQTDITNSALNQYVIPVRLTTSSFTKKTVANDKLIQYTFEIEKSNTLRTQSV